MLKPISWGYFVVALGAPHCGYNQSSLGHRRHTDLFQLLEPKCLYSSISSMGDPADSPASKSFAEKLSRYAFSSGSHTSPLRLSVRREVEVVIPQSPRRAKGKEKIKVEPDEEYEDDNEGGTPTKRRKIAESPAKKSGKKPRPFAGPEVYAHLKPVTDHLRGGLDSGSLPQSTQILN